MIAAALDNNLDSVAATMQPTQQPTRPNIPSEVTGPDAKGEFPSPLAGALWMAAKYQASQIPLQTSRTTSGITPEAFSRD